MFNSRFLFALCFIFLFFARPSFGMFHGTKVLIKNGGHKKVEDLKSGDLVSIYDLRNKSIEKEFGIIRKVQEKKTKEIVIIHTKVGSCVYGLNQLIYNRKIFKFIKAKKLKVGDILYSPELKNLEVEEVCIKKLKKKIGLYYISIENGSLFLGLMNTKRAILQLDNLIKHDCWLSDIEADELLCNNCFA